MHHPGVPLRLRLRRQLLVLWRLTGCVMHVLMTRRVHLRRWIRLLELHVLRLLGRWRSHLSFPWLISAGRAQASAPCRWTVGGHLLRWLCRSRCRLVDVGLHGLWAGSGRRHGLPLLGVSLRAPARLSEGRRRRQVDGLSPRRLVRRTVLFPCH